MIFPSDERLDVFLRVERLEIVDALAEADVLHRHVPSSFVKMMPVSPAVSRKTFAC